MLYRLAIALAIFATVSGALLIRNSDRMTASPKMRRIQITIAEPTDAGMDKRLRELHQVARDALLRLKRGHTK